MATGHLNDATRYVRQLAILREGNGLSDGQLLTAFLAHQDSAAFQVLVKRHGPMVLGVCRRILKNSHDAEDAFQATFLVLLRKAEAIRNRELLGNWLYGVAFRAAMKLKSANATRQWRERQVGLMRPSQAAAVEFHDPLLSVIDHELNRLPDKYRVPIVFCDLEGMTRREAARKLGCPIGTLNWRLAQGRAVLATRLARQGCTLSGGAALALLLQSTCAAVPPGLAASMTKICSLHFAGQTLNAGLISGNVVSLTEGTMKAMLLTKVKTGIAFLLLASVLGVGGSGLGYRVLATEPNAAGTAPVFAGPDQQVEQPEEAKLRQENKVLKEQMEEAKRVTARLRDRLTAIQRVANEGERDRVPPGPVTGNALLAPPGDVVLARFKYRVPFEIGFTENADGGRIEILEVWGTRPLIEIGGQYLVRGKYVMPSTRDAKIYFHETADGWNNTGPDLDLQYTPVSKGQGEFALVHGMGGPGYFHLHLAGVNQGQYVRFANVYFGTGNNVLRKKP